MQPEPWPPQELLAPIAAAAARTGALQADVAWVARDMRDVFGATTPQVAAALEHLNLRPYHEDW